MTIKETAFLGKPLDVPIIDAHTHIGPKYRRAWHQHPDYVSVASQVETYDRLGINCCVTAPHQLCDAMSVLTNETAAKAAEDFPGRVYGYIYVALFEGMDVARQNIEKYSKNPAFVGVKLLGGYQGQYDHPIYQYAADFANEVSCPVLCHTFSNVPPIRQTAQLAENRPNLKLLIAHQGGGHPEQTEEAAKYVREMPNVYMELCGSLYNTLSFADILKLVGEDKMIFGTDAIDLDPRFDFGRVAFADISETAKKKIFAENYLKLLENSELGKIKL